MHHRRRLGRLHHDMLWRRQRTLLLHERPHREVHRAHTAVCPRRPHAPHAGYYDDHVEASGGRTTGFLCVSGVLGSW